MAGTRPARAVPLAQPRLCQFRGLSGRLPRRQAQADPPRAAAPGRGRHPFPHAARDGYLPCAAALRLRHARAQLPPAWPRALPELRVLPGDGAHAGRCADGEAGVPRGGAGGGRRIPCFAGHAVRPLLGRDRQLPQPAFRDLLPPGHRVLHRARHSPLRARHAGRAQDRARLRTDGTRSAHYIADARFRHAIADFLLREREAVAGYSEARRRTCPSAAYENHLACAGRSTDAVPAVSEALDEPAGLLAAGGDLSPERLVGGPTGAASFWYSAGEPVLWWSPTPREVLIPRRVPCIAQPATHVAQRNLQGHRGPGLPRRGRSLRRSARTRHRHWITPEMQHAYIQLHAAGHRAQHRGLVRG